MHGKAVVDGRKHLAQARPVIAAGRPLFIDKPMAARPILQDREAARPAEETLEILAFMQAADQSKRQNGLPATIESVMKQAEGQIAARNR